MTDREALRKRGVYPVLREADKVESSEENSEVIYKIVNFLQRCVSGPSLLVCPFLRLCSTCMYAFLFACLRALSVFLPTVSTMAIQDRSTNSYSTCSPIILHTTFHSDEAPLVIATSTTPVAEGLNEAEDAPLDAEGAALPVPLSDVKEREALALASLRATLDDLD